MTRKKKTRKVAANGTPRLSKEKLQALRALKEQRSKKTKGKKPGSRNAPEILVKEQSNTTTNKDPRVGSKKPISLVAEPQSAESNTQPEMKRHLQPQVKLTTAVETLTPEQELEQLENDERLMALLERHERGELLTGKDAKYFNRGIARHQELCEILGIDDEFEEGDMLDDDPMDQFMSNDLANEWLDDDFEEDDK
ncbi:MULTISPECIES: Der GTPase-activating protein YihI [Pseudoalteromonas]|uniref:Der GTPase-activating protein YihI n=1 Tax=Pseudoalteromonas piscicida TaxID=43662 RepID=A0AAQ2IS28_PSEO7|nr:MULTISPECIES: Der GTPase-activating protein YihI [Pseudoalteromonas]KJY91794.1 GTPase activator [Pseudoalteromonas piscicida]MCO7200425.1 Der GTPase-activating protein YihI [Pseudoalteromonas sp. OANN1]MDP4490544.1 Der GTPase-activating protein YihI [Pseudoalteromonas piscicida]TMN37366.1 GTPase-activating protein [Pseudoalteromonas piscicida]TMN45208.1 GTPase-activating protein [Pseudoalteromonas piscicida]